MNYKVYYDYFDGVKVPIWLVLDVKASEIDWNENIYSFPVQAPFELHSSEDFDTYALNVSIAMNELTLNKELRHVGINLSLVKKRLEEHEIECNEVSNFVIQLGDIEEVLNFTLGE